MGNSFERCIFVKAIMFLHSIITNYLLAHSAKWHDTVRQTHEHNMTLHQFDFTSKWISSRLLDRWDNSTRLWLHELSLSLHMKDKMCAVQHTGSYIYTFKFISHRLQLYLTRLSLIHRCNLQTHSLTTLRRQFYNAIQWMHTRRERERDIRYSYGSFLVS